MIRDKEERSGPIEIDLTGPDGNAYVLMGIARKAAKKLGLDADDIINDMMSDDYEHLIDVFEEHFGEYYILYR